MNIQQNFEVHIYGKNFEGVHKVRDIRKPTAIWLIAAINLPTNAWITRAHRDQAQSVKQQTLLDITPTIILEACSPKRSWLTIPLHKRPRNGHDVLHLENESANGKRKSINPIPLAPSRTRTAPSPPRQHMKSCHFYSFTPLVPNTL